MRNMKKEKVHNNPLLDTARLGNLKLLNALFSGAKKPDLSQTDEDGDNALALAAMAGNTEMVGALLVREINPSHTNKKGWSALMHASYWGHDKVVELLLLGNTKKNINQESNNGNTALIYASMNRHAGIVTQLLAADADATITNKEGIDALKIATLHGHEDITNLLEKPAKAKSTAPAAAADAKSSKPPVVDISADDLIKKFQEIVEDGTVEEVEDLLNKNPGIVDTRLPAGCTALGLAVTLENRFMVAALLRHKADVNIADDDRDTPLHSATQGGFQCLPIVERLLNAPLCDTSLTDKQGKRASEHATSPSIIKLFADHAKKSASSRDLVSSEAASSAGLFSSAAPKAAAVDADAKKSTTKVLLTQMAALLSGDEDEEQDEKTKAAVFNKFKEQFKEFHRLGGKVDEFIDNNTLLMLAASTGHDRIVELLFDHQANENLYSKHTNHWKTTALHLAAEDGHVEVVKRFLAKPSCQTKQLDGAGNTPLGIATNLTVIKLLQDHGKTMAAKLAPAAAASSFSAF